jgi:subtilisin family serine protease
MFERQKTTRRWRLALGGWVAAAVVVPVAPALAEQPQAQSVHDAQWPLQLAQPQKVWALSKGRGVTVAVLDSGVDASHPDLVGRVHGGGDFGDGSSGDGTQDGATPRGHGTEVASLIAATGRNFHAHGLLGLAPEAQILSFGVYRNRVPDQSAIAKAVGSAVDRGAQVILLPTLASAPRPAVVAAVHRAMDQDAVVVSGVGTPVSGSGTTTVARRTAGVTAVTGVVTVTAVDEHGRVWPTTQKGVALAGPGVDVLAASSDRTYWKGSDGAFAASWVAGAAALVRAAHPHWTADQTIAKLVDTARSGGSGCTEGCGYGVVDPLRAVSNTAAPTARTNPLLTAANPRAESATASVRHALDAQRLLLFGISALVVMALYVAVTAVFIHRQRTPTD